MDHQTIAQMLGNYGEFIGSLAILATLVYLSIQVRHSRELLEKQDRVSSSQVHQSRYDSLLARVNTGTELADVVVKYRESGFDSLNDVEKYKLRNSMLLDMANQDLFLVQEELGLLSEDMGDGARRRIQRMYPTWQEADIEIWPRVKNQYKVNDSDDA